MINNKYKDRSYKILFFTLFFSIELSGTGSNLGQNQDNIYKQRFSDVLLVVNFNHPHYANIGFLRDLYSPAFDNIVFYGEREHSDVYNLPTTTGYYLSGVIQDVLNRFPNYRGYLFLQDDCALNFWNYVSYDLEKIWFAVKFNDGKYQNNKFYDIKNVNGSHVGLGGGWGHWVLPWGFKAAWAARARMNASDLRFLQINIGQNNIPCMMCEVFYIPHRFKNDALRLSSVLQNVFCEIAIPTMLCCLDSMSNWEQLNMLGGENIGSQGMSSSKLQPYPINVSWIHPIKFSQQHNRDGIMEVFKYRLAH